MLNNSLFEVDGMLFWWVKWKVNSFDRQAMYIFSARNMDM